MHVVEVVAHRDRPALERGGQQRGRRDQRDLGAEHGAARHVALRATRRVRDVADDGDAQAVERRAAVAAQRERVEQRLRGVLVAAVAGVDDAASIHVRDAVRRAGGGVADDDRVDAHRLDGLHGVAQALALLHRRRARREKVMTSQERRLAAVSNEMRVRVESS